MTAEPLSNLDRSTLRERAEAPAAITSGQYKPGDHLSEVALAGHLGVSRGTVREALRHLQQEGLVTAGNRNMLRVSTVSRRRSASCSGRGGAGGARRSPRSSRRPSATPPSRRSHGAVRAHRQRWRLRDEAGGRSRLPPAAVPLSGNAMLVEAWRHLEGRIRVTIMNCETDNAPSMMARKRHALIVDAIERGDVADANGGRAAHGWRLPHSSTPRKRLIIRRTLTPARLSTVGSPATALILRVETWSPVSGLRAA